MWSRGGSAVLVLLSAALLPACAARGGPPSTPADAVGPEAAGPGERPRVEEIVLEGVTALTEKEVQRAIRLRPGQKMRGPVSGVAGDLEMRYRLRGFVAPRVQGTFDPATGRLTLRADEGRVKEVAFEGVVGDAEAQAREAAGIDTGEPLREKAIRAGLSRIEEASGGALVPAEPPYEVDALDEGVRLRLRLLRHHVRWRLRPRGPDLSPLHNRVEGTAPGASAELTLYDASSFRHTTLYARGSYGFSSDAARWAAGVRRPFGPGGRLLLGYEAHDLTDTDDAFRRRPLVSPSAYPRAFSITEDYFRRRGHEVYAFHRPTPRTNFGLGFRADRHSSLPVVDEDRIVFFAREARDNPVVGEGAMRSLVLAGRWVARGALFTGERAEQESFLLRDLFGGAFAPTQAARVDLTVEVAGGALGGDFDFSRAIAHLRGARDLGRRHSLRGRVLLGATAGDPPPQRRLFLGGAGTLRGYALKEFAGDHALLGTVEWAYALPARWPGLVAFYDGGAAWNGEGADGSGWRDDVGLGLEWPGGAGWLRVDVGYALRPGPGRDRVRVHAVVFLPF